MHKILVSIPVEESHKARLREICPDGEFTYVPVDSATRDEARDAEVILGNVNPAFLKDSPNLRFVQLNSAGTHGFTDPGALPEGTLLANASGAYGLAISEHMLALVFSIMKKLPAYRDLQREHKWVDLGPVAPIWGSKTLVVGCGDIGGEFAKKMHALGSSVTGIRRHAVKADYLDNVGTMEDIYKFLPEADVIAASLPETPDTKKIFNNEFFAKVKPGAFFLNVGRGTAVDQAALIRALEDGRLAAAALEVADPEPLPADDPIWDAPNVIITPHISGGYHLNETRERIFDLAAKNLAHYLAGEPIESAVDFATGYRKFTGK